MAAATAPISLDEEVRLYNSNAEREKYNLLATLFGIIVALDYLERAYVRDSVTAVECVLYFHHSTSAALNCYSIQEVLASMYTATIAVQDHAQVGRG